MKVFTACTTEADASQAVETCFRELGLGQDDAPNWILAYHSEPFDSAVVAKTLSELSGVEAIQGGTSCQGVMAGSGVYARDGVGLGLLAISDPEGSYGVGAAPIGDDPRAAATLALERALEQAGRPAEVPALVWLNAAPGHEEALLAGIEDLLGKQVPIAGGSTADNAVAGRWRQIAGAEVFTDAIVVSALFPSVELSCAFHSGYDPTDTKGQVTRAEGRTILEIDGRSAAVVYDEWTAGLVGDALNQGGEVLSRTALAPLGREVGALEGVPFFKLSHPSRVTSENALTLFTNVQEGDEVVLMQGSRESLISRAGRVARAAVRAGELSPDQVVGALVIYCAGCMLTVQENMDQVAAEISAELGGAPFLGVFTFGEQGCVMGQDSSHGNLMISIVVFSNEPA
jgi:hypothetical protein